MKDPYPMTAKPCVPDTAIQEADRPLTRAEQRERSKSAILSTAIELFAERGFAGVSLDDLAAAAGVKRTLLLYYYKSKEELWRTAAAEVSTAFNTSLTTRIANVRAANDTDRFRATLGASLDTYLEHPNFPRFLVREGGTDSVRLQWLVDHFNYANVQYGSAKIQKYVGTSIMRDVLFAVLLSMAALGPLMEASLSRVAGRKSSGVHPMSKRTRAELVRLMTRFIMTVDDER